MSNLPPQKHHPGKIAAITTGVLLLLIFLTAGFRMLSFAVSKAANGFYYPYLKLVHGTSSEVQDKSLLSLDRLTLARQVEKLSHENRQLAVRSAAAARLNDENRKLREMHNLTVPGGWKFITAEIILRDPLHFRKGFSIDKGSKNGIIPGDAVVDSSVDGKLYLVGVVSECSGHSARVITVMDNSLRIAGRTKNNAVGFTNSGNAPVTANSIRFGMLPIRDDYIADEAVVTTGFEQGIPEGIKIGELLPGDGNYAVYNSNTPDFSCMLKPAVEFETLRFVTVISRQNRSRR